MGVIGQIDRVLHRALAVDEHRRNSIVPADRTGCTRRAGRHIAVGIKQV